MSNRHPTSLKELSPSDPKVEQLNAKLKKERYQPHALIEILHTAQDAWGYLPREVLNYISHALHLPPSSVYSTASFYHLFSLQPKGKHTCVVCTGTACYVHGARNIIHQIEEATGLKAGLVSSDNKLGLRVARCIGVCGLAPVVILDDEVQHHKNTKEIIRSIKTKTGML